MNLDDAPLALLPQDLSDEAAATLLEILYELARVIESHYGSQIQRYYQQPDPDDTQLQLWDDPPF